MIRFPAPPLIAALALAIALPAAALAQAPAWPQAKSDLAPDPAVRFGVLANGMRYAVMRNATPAGQTSLRLRIGSGSLEESDAQQGLAHVLEHMSFRGSTHVAAGEVMETLERLGLSFGADTNASTGWTQTVYMFDLPRGDEKTIDTGLMLMRETAGNLLIRDDALAPERGVVLSEERLRDTPGYRAQKAQIDLLAHGQRISERFPIGQVDVVEHAPASLIRQFYEANYRPDRATLIAVGDFDPAVMEAKIKARFSDWAPVGPPIAEPDLGAVEKRGLTVKVVDLPGGSTRTTIAWVRPYDAAPDTVARRRRDTVEALALAVLDRRLEWLAQGAHPPFLGAQASFQNLIHSDKVAQIDAVSAPGAWRPALDAADAEVRRLVTYGVGQEELDREITEARSNLADAAAGAATRPTSALAGGLVAAVDENEVFTDPAENLALFEADVKGLSAGEVSAAAREIFAGAGPLVAVETPQPIAGGEGEVARVFAVAQASPIAAPVAQTAVVWPYTDFGPAGKVVSRTDIADLGAVAVRFANRVGLTVKPTAFDKDQVLVRIQVAGGRASLPKDRSSPLWASAAFIPGGLGKIGFEDMQRALAAPIFGADFAVGDDDFILGGQTDPKDLATQLQVLAAYLTDPAWRPEPFERARVGYLAALPQFAATPGGVVSQDLASLIRGGDPRWAFPSREDLLAARPDDLKAMVAGALSHAPVEITIVGDVSPDQAIALVASTFGALPPRAPLSPPSLAGQLRFPRPATAPEVRNDNGRPDQAMALVAWPTTGFFGDMARARAASLAGDILQNRILDKVRIAEGSTYSPQTAVDFSQVFPDYGFALTQVETPPAEIPLFFDDVAAIAAELAAAPPSADELERVKNPRIAGIEKAQLTNSYWLERLAGSIADPRRLALIRTTLPDYEKITAADIQAAAARWLVPGRAWKLVVEAHPAALASQGAAP
jgi:zinc protease